MAFEFKCHCGQTLLTLARIPGKQVRCTACGQMVFIPDTGNEAQPILEEIPQEVPPSQETPLPPTPAVPASQPVPPVPPLPQTNEQPPILQPQVSPLPERKESPPSPKKKRKKRRKKDVVDDYLENYEKEETLDERLNRLDVGEPESRTFFGVKQIFAGSLFFLIAMLCFLRLSYLQNAGGMEYVLLPEIVLIMFSHLVGGPWGALVVLSLPGLVLIVLGILNILRS